jgi:NADH:ubiquinone oxidoreductase subunit K
MMTALLAQAGGYSLVHWLIIAIVVCAAIGIAIVAMKQSGITIPPAIWTIIWIVVVAAVAIVAIRILLTL